MDIKESDLDKDWANQQYKLLYKRVFQMKMDELFSEPYDGDMEEEDV